jgi:hypothetical protein
MSQRTLDLDVLYQYMTYAKENGHDMKDSFHNELECVFNKFPKFLPFPRCCSSGLALAP